jgi:hypothetical protein
VVSELEAWVVAASPRPPSWAIEDTEFSGDADCVVEGIAHAKVAKDAEVF